MKNNTHSNKKINKLIRDIPTDHINRAMKKAATNGEINFNFNNYVRRLIANDVDRRRESRVNIKMPKRKTD